MVYKTIIISLVLVISINALAQKNPRHVFFTELGDYRSLFVYDFEKHVSKKLYQTPPQFGFLEYKQSPKKDLVGLLEVNGEHMRPGDLGYAIQDLVIVDTTGKVLARVKEVLDFDWSSTGDSIAFIRGYDYGGHELKPEGVWLLVINSNYKELKISSEKAQELVWARHNNRIYVLWMDIYEIDPQKKTTSITPFKGTFFSPDGMYYFRPNYEGTGFGLFVTSSNAEITPNVIDKEKVNFYQWLDETLLVVGNFTFEKHVIDVRTGEIRSSFTGQVLGFDKETQEIIVRKDRNAFRELSESRFEKINLR